MNFDASDDRREVPEFSPEPSRFGPPFRDQRGRLTGGNPGNSGGKKGRSGRPNRKARLREMIEELRRGRADT
jgi:hypothetical protein